MIRQTMRVCSGAACALLLAHPAAALESEQYTLPPHALVDLGPTLDGMTAQALERVVEKTGPEVGDEAADLLARRLYEELGRGFVECDVERRLRHAGDADPGALFAPKVSHTIYRGVFSPFPFGFYLNAPTANLYGVLVGLDKVGHFFQQGYDYYRIYRRALRAGGSETTAIADAVASGVRSEHSYYGTLVSGVYSNADLAANMAGFRFYVNLTRAAVVGPERLASVLEPARDSDGDVRGWVFHREAFTLRPFFTAHLNEALNPSVFMFNRGKIRRAIQARCAEWLARDAEMTRASEARQLDELSTWFGEDYGHWLPADRQVTLESECFTPPAPDAGEAAAARHTGGGHAG